MLTHSELFLRIAVGAALGAVIGYERDIHGRPVGLRTHLIVALAAATFMVLSSQFAYYQRFDEHGLVEVDASRIAASVVSAVGFLAGGAILRSGMSVQGMTTAAGIWLVTAIGMCAGAGMYYEAVFATALGLFSLAFLRRLEHKDDEQVQRRISLSLDERAEPLSDLLGALRRSGLLIADLEYEKHVGEASKVTLTFDVKHSIAMTVDQLVQELEQKRGVLRVHITQRR